MHLYNDSQPLKDDARKQGDAPKPSWIQQLSNLEALNFLLTNRIPRNLSTRLMGRFSKIEHPLVAKLSIGLWKAFVDDLRLDEAQKSEFSSMHDCFIRELKDGARPIAPGKAVITSPCDAVVGAFGNINDTELYQIKGFPYSLEELLGDSSTNAIPSNNSPDKNGSDKNSTIDLAKYRNGRYITLRIKSSMYHRFHAPTDCGLKQVHYISGDTWNVNPIALKRVEKLFCKNERAILELDLPPEQGAICVVPVAAILVASMRFHALEQTLDLNCQGANTLACDAQYQKGEQMGYFQHGSTIVMLFSPDYEFNPAITEGQIVRVGEALLHHRPREHQ